MRKGIAWLLAGMMLFSQAQAAIAVRTDQFALLMEADGAMLVERGVYDDIVDLGSGYFAAGKDGAYALISSNGSILSDFSYDSISVSKGMIIAQRDGRMAVLNADGSLRSKMLYYRIQPVDGNHAWALRSDPNDAEADELYIIEANGNLRSTGIFILAMGTAGKNGLLPVLLSGKRLYGYCDGNGRLVIAAQYTFADGFHGQLAAVVSNGKYGAINNSGRMVIPAEYDYLTVAEAGFAAAHKNGVGVSVFRADGTLIDGAAEETAQIAVIGDKYLIFGGEINRLCAAGGMVLAELNATASVYEGLDGSLIVSDGAWGEECVYLLGSERRYQHLYPLAKGQNDTLYVFTTMKTASFANDLLGEVQLSWDPDSLRCGLTGQDGEVLLPAEYLSIQWLGEDRVLATTQETYQVMDAQGKVYWEAATEAPKEGDK